MSQIVPIQSPLSFVNNILQFQELNAIEGERYLSFNLDRGINALILLADLRGVIELSIEDILPVPQTHESLLGIINWRGKATWTIDLAGSVGAPHWCRRDPILAAGVVMLVEIQAETVGFLVERIGTIEIYKNQDCLSVSAEMFARELRPFLQGYFLDSQQKPKVVLDLQQVRSAIDF
jgi:positive phototaxis protein PixI